MPQPSDTSPDDYDDGPRGPEPVVRPAPTWNPRNACLGIGIISGLVLVCSGLLIYSDTRLRGAGGRMNSSGNLKQLALAVHNYQDTWGQLPHNTCAPDGKPLLSWRVHILPYIEEEALYNAFDLDEPWDGPTNIRLLGLMPRIYAHPNDRHRPGGTHTYYRGFSSPGAVFERRACHRQPRFLPLVSLHPDPRQGLRLADFRDTAGDTFLIVEAGDPVEWTKPEDLDAAPGRPFPRLGGMGWKKVFQAAMADGSIRSFPLDTPEDVLRAHVTHSGGEPIPVID